MIVSGCSSSPKFTKDFPIQKTTIKNLGKLADDFATRTYNNFYQFEINYLDYKVNELRLNYYKDGEIKKNFCYLTERIKMKSFLFLTYNISI